DFLTFYRSVGRARRQVIKERLCRYFAGTSKSSSRVIFWNGGLGLDGADRAGRDQDLEHRAFGMDVDRKRRVGRHAAAKQRGGNCNEKRTAGDASRGFN